MKIVVGLGNPGERYKETRHNAGFMFVERLRNTLINRGYSFQEWENEAIFNAQISKGTIDGQDILLVKPQLFMNRSGEVVAKILEKKNVADLNSSLVLIHDDLDIKLGQYKIQYQVSPKGHNGVNDIEAKVHGVDFLRVRVGVDDREDRNMPPDAYVLERLDEVTLSKLSAVLDEAIEVFTSQLLS